MYTCCICILRSKFRINRKTRVSMIVFTETYQMFIIMTTLQDRYFTPCLHDYAVFANATPFRVHTYNIFARLYAKLTRFTKGEQKIHTHEEYVTWAIISDGLFHLNKKSIQYITLYTQSAYIFTAAIVLFFQIVSRYRSSYV